MSTFKKSAVIFLAALVKVFPNYVSHRREDSQIDISRSSLSLFFALTLLNLLLIIGFLVIFLDSIKTETEKKYHKIVSLHLSLHLRLSDHLTFPYHSQNHIRRQTLAH